MPYLISYSNSIELLSHGGNKGSTLRTGGVVGWSSVLQTKLLCVIPVPWNFILHI